MQRVLADGALGVEEEAICSVYHSRMDVGDLSPEWEWVEDHGVKELGGKYNGLCLVVAELDDILLDPADLLDWQDRSELTTRDHDSI